MLSQSIVAQTFTNENALIPSSFTSYQPVGVADINGDFLDDIIRLNGSTLQVCYQQSDGTYTTSSIPVPYTPWGMCVADVNGDGFNDILYGGFNQGSSDIQLSLMDSNGIPQNSTPISASVFVQGINFVDIDEDGHIDSYVCHDNAANITLRNTGSGSLVLDNTMMPSSPHSGNYGSIWSDYDGDGDLDCYVTKCRLGITNPSDPRRINILWRNDGGGNFTEVAGSLGLDDGAQSWSADFADIDNDGDMDLYILNHTDSQRMYENVNGTFVDISSSAGLTFSVSNQDWQSIFDDFDNDGFVDLLITGLNSRLYRNNGDNTFTLLSNFYPFTTDVQNAAVGDLNNDGYLDIYATFESWSGGAGGPDIMLHNASSGKNWIKFNLVGTQSNRNAIGARIKITGSWGTQTREIRSGEGYGIMNSLQQHFGTDSDTVLPLVEIFWPSGNTDVLNNVSVNQTYTLTECANMPSTNPPTGVIKLRSWVFLGGCFQPNQGMHTDLSNAGLIPFVEPYTALPGFTHAGGGGGETIIMCDTSGIVDWVFLELRDASNAVIETQSALLLSNGQIVGRDGDVNLYFNAPPNADYYLAVKHRNHLGVITQNPVTMSDTQVTFVDFRSMSADVAPYSMQSQMFNTISVQTLWPGDGNQDKKVVYQGSGSDILPITTTVFSDPSNPNFQLTLPVQGYFSGDYNMDGQVIYQGSNSDIISITQSVFSYPLNQAFELTFPVNDQIP